MLYLIHFEQPYKHAKHYLGYVKEPWLLERRMKRHGTCEGSALMRAVRKAGIKWRLVAVWPEGNQTRERQLKNRKETPKFCPCCGGKLPHDAVELKDKPVYG